MSRVLPLALAAATEALRTAGIDTASLPLEQKRRFGVILGSGGGSQEFTEEQYRLFFHRTIQADEFVLRAHRSDGYIVERTECALRVARAQSRGDDRLHFVH